MKLEFSKIIMVAVMFTYFIGVAVGALVVLSHDPDQLQWYLTFISAPTAIAIGFYAWKAKAENVIKLGLKDKIPLEFEDNR